MGNCCSAPSPSPRESSAGAAGEANRCTGRPPEGLPPQNFRARTTSDKERYSTCLDREFVQFEIRCARKYKKKIVLVYESEPQRAGYFDIARARSEYEGTEWDDLFNIDAIRYHREERHAKVMMIDIIERAPAGGTAQWDFFLSHHAGVYSAEAQTTHLRLKELGKTSWYDNAMRDKSTAAMENGVKNCGCFVLFLTSIPSVGVQRKIQTELSGNSNTQPDLLGLCRLDKQRYRRIEDFSGRPALKQEVISWSLDERQHGHRSCLLMGLPGAGKTTFLTELIADEAFSQSVLAAHFCEACDSRSLTPTTFLQNFTKQLYQKADVYREMVESDEILRQSVCRIIEGRPSQGQVDVLDDLIQSVLKPLQDAYPGTDRPPFGHVLVVDSLDEALLFKRGSIHTEAKGIFHLLKQLNANRSKVPNWLKVLATSRDVPQVKQLKSWQCIDLTDAAHSHDTQQSLRAYINSRLADTESRLHGHYLPLQCNGFNCNSAAAAHLTRLVDQSEGIFLYVHSALNDIEVGCSQLEDVHALPAGLGELLSVFFERDFESAESDQFLFVRPVFEAIAASFGGVSEPVLLQCLRLADPEAESKTLNDRLKSVWQYLRHIPGPRIGHRGILRCKHLHEMHPLHSEKNFCDICKSTGTAFRCEMCDYDICELCGWDGPDSPTTDSVLNQRLSFYHLAMNEWLTETENDWYIDVVRGHTLLGIVQFAALVADAADGVYDRLAQLAITQLGCDRNLKTRHLRLAASATAGCSQQGVVYDVAQHLGEALEAKGHLPVEFGELARDAHVNVEACWRCEGEWFNTRPICHAAGSGNIRALKFLTEARADLQCKGGSESPLHCAVRKNRNDVIDFLSQKYTAHVIPRTRGGLRPLHVAAEGRLKALRALCRAGLEGDVNEKDQIMEAAVHIAARCGCVNEIAALHKAGADLNLTTVDNMTALHLAAQRGFPDVVAKLVNELGANAQAATDKGRTALHVVGHHKRSARVGGATFSVGCEKVTRLLCSSTNAIIEHKDDLGWTPLVWACCKSLVDVVRVLLDAGANVDVVANDGSNPLMWAVKGGPVAELGPASRYTQCAATIVRLLLERGADRAVRAFSGLTACDIARERLVSAQQSLQAARREDISWCEEQVAVTKEVAELVNLNA